MASLYAGFDVANPKARMGRTSARIVPTLTKESPMSKTLVQSALITKSTASTPDKAAQDAFLTARAAAGPVGKCGMTKEQFLAEAKPLHIIVNGQTVIAMPKAFSTGSFGYYLGDKTAIEVAGRPLRLQLGMNATVIGSNPNKGGQE